MKGKTLRSDCKVRTQEAENFDEEVKSLVSARRLFPSLVIAGRGKGKRKEESSVRLGHNRLRTLMKRSSLWYLLGELFIFVFHFLLAKKITDDDRLSTQLQHR